MRMSTLRWALVACGVSIVALGCGAPPEPEPAAPQPAAPQLPAPQPPAPQPPAPEPPPAPPPPSRRLRRQACLDVAFLPSGRMRRYRATWRAKWRAGKFARPPATPTVWAIGLRVEGNRAEFLDARLARGDPRPVALADRRSSIRLGRSAWFEYRLEADDGSAVLTGGLAVSTSAIVEPVPGGNGGGHIRMGRRVVTIVVPYREDVQTISMLGVVPSSAWSKEWPTPSRNSSAGLSRSGW